MSDHGRDKTGPVRDDELKKELEGELRAGRSTRMEEEHEPQPPGEDQPQADVAAGTALIGGTPPGMTPKDVELRSELARHLGREPYPARREALLETLRRNHAPDRLVDLAARLPEDEEYHNVQDIARALGLGVEDHRT
ncbi:DUF2795 domain-containing protein [Streptantibioticus rubrisoli]|uniref:DUF2795 domain-containing protein n=1 Tax=Streptantibioticus rubrisoli TaxID=1387313 RepID=A0ABT1PBE2_9ACTN|nr:DUF2795 domain-containing protein [Streptantibioticus rubrisoli]MCQ4042695.1 DUF2795 domain-containing protein [Streptantibioticus rubrisoli]